MVTSGGCRKRRRAIITYPRPKGILLPLKLSGFRLLLRELRLLAHRRNIHRLKPIGQRTTVFLGLLNPQGPTVVDPAHAMSTMIAHLSDNRIAREPPISITKKRKLQVLRVIKSRVFTFGCFLGEVAVWFPGFCCGFFLCASGNQEIGCSRARRSSDRHIAFPHLTVAALLA